MKTRKGEIAIGILTAIGFTGLFAMSLVAPNILTLFPRKFFERRSKYAVLRSFDRLREKGLIKTVRNRSGWHTVLTDKGREALLLAQIRQQTSAPKRRWDKKWRFLIFDILESQRHIRDKVRRTLVSLGFYPLQKSVWVYPYECEEVLELLRLKHGVWREALYICAEDVGNDQVLRNKFGLS